MSADVTTWGFVILAALAAALVIGPTVKPSAMATNRELLQSLFSARVTRVACVVVWWWLGWHFLGTG